ncbi:MAG: cytochrome c maturation protein CcmE [Anaerolineales bacterium]
MMDELQSIEAAPRKDNKTKFIIGGVIIVGAIIFLIISSLSANVQYFLTVDEAVEKGLAGELSDRNIRVSGAVLGDTIKYDMDTLELSFRIAHVPADNQLLDVEGGLASALYNAVQDPERSQLEVIYTGPIPDLLQNEAQAIITGELLASGVIEADEILLKCPTKYEGSAPEQVEQEL